MLDGELVAGVNNGRVVKDDTWNECVFNATRRYFEIHIDLDEQYNKL